MSELPDDINPPQRADTPPETHAKLYRLLAAATLALIGLGTVMFHWLEGWDWIDSFYFSVVAATTVGFGDFAPDTDGGKLFSVLYILLGISLITTFLDARFKKAISRRIAREERRPGSHRGPVGPRQSPVVTSRTITRVIQAPDLDIVAPCCES